MDDQSRNESIAELLSEVPQSRERTEVDVDRCFHLNSNNTTICRFDDDIDFTPIGEDRNKIRKRMLLSSAR